MKNVIVSKDELQLMSWIDQEIARLQEDHLAYRLAKEFSVAEDDEGWEALLDAALVQG